MKDSNYIHISYWMGTKLGLRANDLICFSVIFGFSQDGESQFKGNLDYLAQCMFASVPTALLSIKKLLKAGYIKKDEVMINGKKHCYYKTIVQYDNGEIIYLETTKEPLGETTKEPLGETTKESLGETTKESLDNNKYNGNKKKDNKEKRLSNDNPKEDLDFDSFYKLYPQKKSKDVAKKAWNKLSVKDKKDAIDKLPAYIADCVENKRSFKYPATYLNQRTWEDDFINSNQEEEKKEEANPYAKWPEQKAWIEKNCPKLVSVLTKEEIRYLRYSTSPEEMSKILRYLNDHGYEGDFDEAFQKAKEIWIDD